MLLHGNMLTKKSITPKTYVVGWRKVKNHEKVERSLIKSLSFRCLVVTSDFVVIFLLTHRYDLTIGVVIISNLSSTMLYFLHERIWNGIAWGRMHAKRA